MMSAVLAASLVGLVIAPHALPQSRLPVGTGIALWLATLALRAMLALSLALIAFVFLPATELFRLLTHWCLHGVLPFFATHLGLDGHRFGDAAVFVPAIAIAGFSVSALFGIWRAGRAVRGWLRGSALGRGPRRSVIVGGSEVLVAAAGLRDPRVVVSAGALLRLDDEELAAGLEHEWGHIAHRHRFIVLLGHIFFALARLLPGSRRALGQLHFQLERDADQYAVMRTGDSLALASAISKAAGGSSAPPGPAFASLATTGVPERLRLLLGRGSQRPTTVSTALARMLATAATVLALALVGYVPTVAAANFAGPPALNSEHGADCPS